MKLNKLKRLAVTALAAITFTLGITGCGSKATSTGDKTVVKLGVVGSIYQDLWAPAKQKLAEQGIDLQIQEFSDYTTPNNALNSGEIDLNAFQHQIYLNAEVASYGYNIQAVGDTFIIPLNLYSNKVKSVSEIKDGDTIAIPNDVTNGGRALKVLEAAGLITLKTSATDSPTVNDIENYRVQIKIKELAANTIPSVLSDVTAGIVNGNYALDYNFKLDDAVFKDTSLDQDIYWNLVAARSEDLKDATKADVYKKVIEAFQSEDTENIFNQEFGGYLIKAGWDKGFFTE